MHRGYTPGSCLGIILTELTYLRRECALLLAVASPNRFWRSSTDDFHLQIRWRASVERAQAFHLVCVHLLSNDTLPELVDFDVRKVVVADCDRI